MALHPQLDRGQVLEPRPKGADVSRLTQTLDAFLIARWGKQTLERSRGTPDSRPWGAGAEPTSLHGMTWTVFGDQGEPVAVGIRPDGVRGDHPIFLIAYWRRSGKVELHHWRQDASTGWQHIAELFERR